MVLCQNRNTSRTAATAPSWSHLVQKHGPQALCGPMSRTPKAVGPSTGWIGLDVLEGSRSHSACREQVEHLHSDSNNLTLLREFEYNIFDQETAKEHEGDESNDQSVGYLGVLRTLPTVDSKSVKKTFISASSHGLGINLLLQHFCTSLPQVLRLMIAGHGEWTAVKQKTKVFPP